MFNASVTGQAYADRLAQHCIIIDQCLSTNSLDVADLLMLEADRYEDHVWPFYNDESSWFGGYATAGDQADDQAIDAAECAYEDYLHELEIRADLEAQFDQAHAAEDAMWAERCTACGCPEPVCECGQAAVLEFYDEDDSDDFEVLWDHSDHFEFDDDDFESDDELLDRQQEKLEAIWHRNDSRYEGGSNEPNTSGTGYWDEY